MTEVVLCDQAHEERWDAYVKTHPQARFYHLFGWKKINETNFGHRTFFLSAMRDQRVVGIFPLVFINSAIFGKILTSMPFVNYGGICADDWDAEKALLEKAQGITVAEGIDYLEIRSIKKLEHDLPTSEQKISMTLELDADPDTLWNGFRSKHRTNIRRVYKEGISVQQGGVELLDDFYNVLSESWKALGTPIYRKSYFHSLFATFGADIQIFTANLNGNAIAVAFNGHCKGTVEGMWAGSLRKHRHLQPNYLLYWEMMKDACEKGNLRFHLGRSTVGSGAEDFKKKWNAHPQQLYWQYYLNKSQGIPQLNVSNPKFQLAIRAWQKLPMLATQWVGPFVSKFIP